MVIGIESYAFYNRKTNITEHCTMNDLYTKYNLYRIFDNFLLTNKYPFIQYQTPDGQIRYKFNTKSSDIENSEILYKWFENAPYGLKFIYLSK